MLGEDPPPSGSERARGEREFLIPELHHPAADDARHSSPARNAYRDANRDDTGIEHQHDQDRYHQVGDAVEDLDDALHNAVYFAAEEPRDSPERDPYGEVEQGGEERNVERDPHPLPNANEHVAAELIRAHQVFRRSAEVASGHILGVGRVWN